MHPLEICPSFIKDDVCSVFVQIGLPSIYLKSVILMLVPQKSVINVRNYWVKKRSNEKIFYMSG